MNVPHRKTPANEPKKPRMLKDFLSESPPDSWPSGAGIFKSIPAQPCSNTTCSHYQYHSNPNSTMKLLRSRSKAASAATISAVQALINAFKKYPPIFLPRKKYYNSSSSKEAGRSTTSHIDGAKIRFRVKDIVRWSSFKDLVEEKSRPLEIASSPDDDEQQQQQQFYYCTTTNSSNTTCSSSSNGSSWCESDFTSSEYLLWSSSWHAKSKESCEYEVKVRKKYLPSVGRDCLEVTAGTESYADMEVGPKIAADQSEENEQQSPISVLDFQVGENEDPFSAFTRSIAGVERTRQNLMLKIQQFENLAKLESFNLEAEWMLMEDNTEFGEVEHHNEEDEDENGGDGEQNELEKKARELVNHIEATSSIYIGNAKVVHKLLLDFFGEHLSTKKRQTKKDDDDFEREMVNMAKAWMRGEHNVLNEWRLEHKREAYIREMDRRESWSKFEEELKEVALEIEAQVLGFLVDEVFVDLLPERMSIL